MARYYTLAFLHTNEQTGIKVWGPEFGSYDKSEVIDEYNDYVEHGVDRKHFRIFSTGDSQVAIDNEFKRLNTKRLL